MLNRSRPVYALAVLIVIGLGLASRAEALPRPALVASYGGDTLWALLVFLLIGWLLPNRPTLQVALLALGFALAIEISQLYSAPWLDVLRQTLAGRLVLGAGFLWSDLLCYTVGVLGGVALECVYRRWFPSVGGSGRLAMDDR